jgi:hypothetical protein
MMLDVYSAFWNSGAGDRFHLGSAHKKSGMQNSSRDKLQRSDFKNEVGGGGVGRGRVQGEKFENLRDSMWTYKKPDWFSGLGEFNIRPISCETMRCFHWRAKYGKYVACPNVRV